MDHLDISWADEIHDAVLTEEDLDYLDEEQEALVFDCE